MAVVNKRIFCPTATAVNGVSVGGTVSVRLTAGFDNILRSGADGLQVPIVDRDVQFVRGSVTVQDWPKVLDLLTGTVSNLVFYERKSGTGPTGGYIKHTLNNPCIHNIRLEIRQGSYASVSFDFECRFGDETAAIADVWQQTDAQNAPTYVSAARGGWRIRSCLHGNTAIAHPLGLSLSVSVPMLRACNDADLGYTAVDLSPECGLAVNGSLSFQDASIQNNVILSNQLLTSSAAALQLVLVQSAGGTPLELTIAGVLFGSADASGGQLAYDVFSMPFSISNNLSAPLTLEGPNKLLIIEEAP
ncbi:MAG TPA: hypothetical protein PKY88_12635 [Anaerohalosphaeraceae bacterium]|nr:hypothetical protein [Anaerohalosphaeraceae bacterium]